MQRGVRRGKTLTLTTRKPEETSVKRRPNKTNCVMRLCLCMSSVLCFPSLGISLQSLSVKQKMIPPGTEGKVDGSRQRGRRFPLQCMDPERNRNYPAWVRIYFCSRTREERLSRGMWMSRVRRETRQEKGRPSLTYSAPKYHY